MKTHPMNLGKRPTSVTLLLFALVICMSFTLFAGCADEKQGDAITTEPAATTPPATEAVDSEPNFPDVSFYREIKILQSSDLALEEWNSEEEGNVILEQAIVDKISYLEEKYTIEFSYLYSSKKEFTDRVTTPIQGQYGAYDFISFDPAYLTGLANKGLLRTIQSVENIDLDNEWWSQSVNRRLAYKGNNFFAVGASNVNANWRTSGVFFNKTIASAIGVSASELYRLVNDHAWTLEAMLSYAKLATQDSGDGTDVISANDTFGVLQTEAWYSSIMGYGIALATTDEEGKFVVNKIEQSLIDAVTEVIVYMNDTDIALPVSARSGLDEWKQFYNGKGLFLLEGIAVSKQIRNYDVDYGILPSPLGETGQAEYYNYIHHGHSSATAVPVDVMNEDLPMIGALLEEANYISRKEVWPSFYDTLMKGQIARDPESAAVLDIIFNSMTTDPGIVYGNAIDQAIRTMIRENQSTAVSSKLNTAAENLQTILNGVNESYESFLNK